MKSPIDSTQGVASRARSRRLAGVLALLLLTSLACGAPLPPIPKVTITGTVVKVTWIPKKSVEGIPGFSGSAGKDRVFPAHLEVTLRDYSGPTAAQAWLMNAALGEGGGPLANRRQPPPRLLVRVNTEDRGLLKAGMRVRLVNYTLGGDEGGTWTSCERVERLGDWKLR